MGQACDFFDARESPVILASRQGLPRALHPSPNRQPIEVDNSLPAANFNYLSSCELPQ